MGLELAKPKNSGDGECFQDTADGAGRSARHARIVDLPNE